MANEKRLIDLNKIKPIDFPSCEMDGLDVIRYLETLPTVDAVEVVHGRWVDHMVRDWRCSECGEAISKVRNVDGYCYDDKPHYCPNCGAKMDGGNEDA